MKKIRLILAAMTAVSAIYMIYANWSVRGFHLFTMDSTAGHRAAVTYRGRFLCFSFCWRPIFWQLSWQKSREKKNSDALPVERFAARGTSSAKNAAILLQKPAEFLLEESAVWI